MTEHSIEELERQLQSAKDRAKEAQAAVSAAAERLQQARNDASGIIGHVLEYDYHIGYGKKARMTKRRLFVTVVRQMYNGLSAGGKLIIADGSIGVRTDTVLISKATDLGARVV